jgi:NitT/TauT family transport system ATP-binding protein
MTPFVALENVTHVYPGAEEGPAVEDLSLAIREGDIVGPSGCGKSTLMKLATGLQFPRSGAVTVAGRRVGAPVKLAGMAFQNPTMLPWRTTLQNLLLPLEIVEPHRSRIRRRKAEYVAKAEALLAQVGLAGQGGKYPWQLSGGMQQRASLCRALIHEPQLLMLDEPFAALDAFTREELWCVIRDLHAARAFTVVLVTHDLRGDVPRRPRPVHERAAGPHRRGPHGRPAPPARPRGHLRAGLRRHRPGAARPYRAGEDRGVMSSLSSPAAGGVSRRRGRGPSATMPSRSDAGPLGSRHVWIPFPRLRCAPARRG